MRDKGFYKLIEKKRKDIDSLDISRDKKDGLYQLVDETIVRHEENKYNFPIIEEFFKDFVKGQASFILKTVLKDSKPKSDLIN